MEIFEATLGLLAAALLLSALAGRLAIPYPSVLVIGGLALGFLPMVPGVGLDPDLAFALFLPPILFEAAFYTSWRDFRANGRVIGSLAILLVGITTWVVAVVADRLIPEMPIQAAWVLGAIVSPPDAAAATAVLGRMRLPRRIVAIVEGESLVNDAVALVLYDIAVELTVVGHFSPAFAATRLAVSVIGSIALGLAIGWAFSKLAERIADPVISVSASFLVAFGTYLAAIAIHVSGVLAVVAAGLFFAWRAPRVLTPDVRLSSTAVWKIAIFILNALAFVLIGLQLPQIIKDLPAEYTLQTLAIDAGVIAGTVILVRLVWVVGASQLLRRIGGEQARREIGNWREAVVIGWSGMRGLISLAAALALPEVTDNGQPFPARALILFLAFAVILATLVIQGLSLGTVIRLLKIEGDPDGEREERLARTEATHAALATIERLSQTPGALHDELDRLRLIYVTRLRQWTEDDAQERTDPSSAEFADAARLAAVAAERQALLDLRHRRLIGDEALHRVQGELDLIESAVKRHRPGYTPTTWFDLARRSAGNEPGPSPKQ